MINTKYSKCRCGREIQESVRSRRGRSDNSRTRFSSDLEVKTSMGDWYMHRLTDAAQEQLAVVTVFFFFCRLFIGYKLSARAPGARRVRSPDVERTDCLMS